MIMLSTVLTCAIVIATVSLHYEALRLLSVLQRKEKRWYSNRTRASLLVLGCILAHAVEVTLFGVGFYILEATNQAVDLQGAVPDGFNFNYFSFVVYTSIGFGDVVPVTTSVRILTAAEGLTGAILIAWTASFMFFHMQRFWELELNDSATSGNGNLA